MPLDIKNPRATVTLAFRGLSVFCYNSTFNNGDGRWEIAIPHFSGHEFAIDLPGLTLAPGQSVQKISIRARVGVPPNGDPRYRPTPFDRQDFDNTDRNHFGWLTDFTDSRIHNGTASIIKKTDSGIAARVGVTLIYVYQALGYTKARVANPLILATQSDTCPVVNGVPAPLANDVAGAALDRILDRDAYGYCAQVVGLDIEGGPGAGAPVDISFDNVLQATIQKSSQPQQVTIRNLEPPGHEDPSAIVKTSHHNHGRGDFFRYYEMLKTPDEHLHLWERTPPDAPQGSQRARTGDCNAISVSGSNFQDLGALL
jgi:hypothetical protein